MAKDYIFSNDFDVWFKDKLVEYLADLDTREINTNQRVNDLITGVPQPSEVVDARLGEPTLRDKLEKTDSQLAEKAKEHWIDASKYATLQEAFNAVPENGILWLEPNKTYTVTGTITPVDSLTVYCNNAKIKYSTGTYTSVLVGGSLADTGYKVLFDLKNANNSQFIGKINFDLFGSTNMVALASSQVGLSNGGFISNFDQVFVGNAYVAIYNQTTTAPVAGTFTGSRISTLQCEGCTYDTWLRGSQDDFVIGNMRSKGIIRVDASGLKIESLYRSGQGTTQDGIMIGDSTVVVVDHAFFEHTFQYPVVFNGANGQFDCPDVYTSPGFDSKNGEIFYMPHPNCILNVHINNLSRQATTISGAEVNGLKAIVNIYKNAGTTYNRMIKITTPIPKSVVPFIMKTGASEATNDYINVVCDEGELIGKVNATEILYLSRPTRLTKNGQVVAGTSQTYTFTLPQEGTYLLVAYVKGNNADRNHSARIKCLIDYSNSINDMLFTETLGTTRMIGNATGLTVSAPNDSGIITITFTQTTSAVSEFRVSAVLISNE